MNDDYGGYDERAEFAAFYDIIYDRIGPKDIDFFVEYSRNAGGRTLELACGTGRILLPTAIAGCDITGLDLSSAMLRECRRKLDEQPVEVRERVNLIQGNIANFESGEKYLLVTIPFRSFQLIIEPEKHKSCLRNVHRHLADNSLLIIDVYKPKFSRLDPSPEYAEEIGDLPETALPGGRTIRRTNRTLDWNRSLQYNEIELAHYLTNPDGTTETIRQQIKMHYFFRYEMEYLLELCGFRVVDLFGNFDRSPFKDDSPEMIVVAKKVG